MLLHGDTVWHGEKIPRHLHLAGLKNTENITKHHETRRGGTYICKNMQKLRGLCAKPVPSASKRALRTIFISSTQQQACASPAWGENSTHRAYCSSCMSHACPINPVFVQWCPVYVGSIVFQIETPAARKLVHVLMLTTLCIDARVKWSSSNAKGIQTSSLNFHRSTTKVKACLRSCSLV